MLRKRNCNEVISVRQVIKDGHRFYETGQETTEDASTQGNTKDARVQISYLCHILLGHVLFNRKLSKLIDGRYACLVSSLVSGLENLTRAVLVPGEILAGFSRVLRVHVFVNPRRKRNK